MASEARRQISGWTWRRQVERRRSGASFPRTPLVAALGLLVFCAAALAPAGRAAAFQVLVTNDDGVAAEGIAVLVERLAAEPGVDVVVVAPAENQSGTGDRFTEAPFAVREAETSRGHPATALEGFPADTVLFAVLGRGMRPDLVVSGINAGQNVAELVNVSGTVGAARAAARLGIPAFAVSQGLSGAIRYDEAADYVASLVDLFRTSTTFRRLMAGAPRAPTARILNINFPTCDEGELRGVRLVRLGRLRRVAGYEPAGGDGTWQAVIARGRPGSTDCRSSLALPADDLEAMNNGFAAVTPLEPDLEEPGIARAFARFVQGGSAPRVVRELPRQGGAPPPVRRTIRPPGPRLPRLR